MWTEITRPKYERHGLRYASDLTCAEWNLIEPYMPRAKAVGRPRRTPKSDLGSWALAAPGPDPGPAIFRLDFPRKGSVAAGQRA